MRDTHLEEKMRANFIPLRRLAKVSVCQYICFLFVFWAFATALTSFVYAQQNETPAPEIPTREQIQESQKALEAITDLDEALKKSTADFYARALQEHDSLQASQKAIEAHQKLIDNADQLIAESKQKSEALPEEFTPPTLSGATLQELEKFQATAEEKFKTLSAELAKLEAEPKRRATRRTEIGEQIAEAQAELEKIHKALLDPPPPDESATLTAARRTYETVRHEALTQKISSLEKERANFEATDELVQIDLDSTAKEFATAERIAKFWRDKVNEQRKREADKQARQAKRDATLAIPEVSELAALNTELAEERQRVAAQIAAADEHLAESEEIREAVKAGYEQTKERDEAVGLSPAIGRILRQQRAKLPHARQYERNIQQRQAQRSDVAFTQYRYADRRNELANLKEQAAEVVRQLNVPATEEIEAAITEQLETERGYLDDLTKDYRIYSEKLLELDVMEEEILRTVREYAQFIDERVLWISSADLLSVSSVRPGLDAAARIVNLGNWQDVWRVLTDDFRRTPLVWCAFLLAFGALLFLQGGARRQIDALGHAAARPSFAEFWPTMKALFFTVVIAIPWPILLWFVSWRLGQLTTISEFTRSVAEGLNSLANLFFPVEMLRQICRPHGVAEYHFGWPSSGLKVVRHHTRLLIWIGIPLVLLVVFTESQNVQPLWSTSLGRVAFILGQILLADYAFRILRIRGGALTEALAYHHESWIYRLRRFWLAIGVASPLALAVLAFIGYYFTAQELAVRMFHTVCLVLELVVVGSIFMRWTLISRRALAREQARQRRAAMLEAAAASEEGTPTPVVSEEPVYDLAKISDQTRQLISTVLMVVGFLAAWFIWDDVLPALSMFREVSLGPLLVDLTLADLVLALVVVFVTFMAARNVPGLLELTILKHLPLDAGARYATSTIARYVIAIVGVVIVGSALHIDGSSMQWLVAALGVGLGFGLQEILANFVSGLILLFERPIRVGDIVILGDVTGQVSRIRIRATTILNWDGQELIVPNKELVTGRLMNWTLSDAKNRIVINVGVAYGSDTQKVTELLQKVAGEHELILADPAPIVTFEGFGDSTLNFVLRCFLPDLSNRLGTIHELHTRIDAEFRAANIEIAFPQRDLHIRTIPRSMEKIEQLSNRASEMETEAWKSPLN